MKHFRGIGFENFKVFKGKQWFDFAPITILTGTNNSGKSSLINGLRLLNDNFSDLRPENGKWGNPSLNDILKTSVEVKGLLERYGNLEQFITKGSDKNEFRFFSRARIPGVDFEADNIEIAFTVRIEDDDVKGGYISDIEMKTIKTGQSLLHIYESVDQGEDGKKETPFGTVTEKRKGNILTAIKINFQYFFEILNYRIERSIGYHSGKEKLSDKVDMLNMGTYILFDLKKELEEFNREFSSSLSLEQSTGDERHFLSEQFDSRPAYLIDKKDIIQVIEGEKQCNSIINIASLWEYSGEFKKKIERLVSNYYGKPLNESFYAFNEDILKFLAAVEWRDTLPSLTQDDKLRNVDFLFDEEYQMPPNKCFLERFLDLFSSISYGADEDFKLYTTFFQNAIVQNKEFYHSVFEEFLMIVRESILDKYQYVESLEDSMAKMEALKKLYKKERWSATKAGELFYEQIKKYLGLVTGLARNMQMLNFLTVSRISTKRIYSYSGSDEFSKMVKNVSRMKDADRKAALNFLNRWIREFGLGDELVITPDPETENFKVYIRSGDKKTILADMGFGVNQILPILFKLIPKHDPWWGIDPWTSQFESNVVIIEEPETNLHPALQSKLADMFAEAAHKFNIQILIETHSEYLIRKLQYLVAKAEIASDFTNIYYFYPLETVPEGEPQIKLINIQKDGSLTSDFGTGFFDEADKIALSLWSLNNVQKN